MNIEQIQKIYFLGIGGIGMSALARYFNHLGIEVYGYDKTKTQLTEELENEGMQIHYDENLSLIPKGLDWVVYTPAIPKDHIELMHFQKQNKIPISKRAQMLGLICKDKPTIAIAGSHGKTTITAMLAHVLKSGGLNPTAFIGGITANYKTNFVPGNGELFVVEADEYDRSFHQLFPNMAVVTAIDDDHLEIYGNKEGLIKSFEKFIGNIDRNGTLLIKHGLETNTECYPKLSLTYHLYDTQADYSVRDLMIKNNQYCYNTVENSTRFKEAETEKSLSLFLNIGGKHNVENTIPVIAIAKKMGLTNEQIQAGIASFEGIKRRFEYVWNEDDLIIIDDYAHHPQELKMLIESVQELYPNKKITIVFQPHLYSRTQNLAKEFAESLSLVEEVCLMEIYPAREKPIEGVSSDLIKQYLNNCDSYIYNKKNIVNLLKEKEIEVLVLVGAGDIGEIVLKIKEALIF